MTRPDGQDTYTYDTAAGAVNAYGRLAAVTFTGRPAHASGEPDGNSQFTYTYSYTPAGLVTAKSMALWLGPYSNGPFQVFSLAAPTLTAAYQYNYEGKLTSVSYPVGGPTFSYGYDTMGRPNSLAQTGGTSVVPGGRTW